MLVYVCLNDGASHVKGKTMSIVDLASGISKKTTSFLVCNIAKRKLNITNKIG